ncbi:MAG: ATP-binding cassette domain-containing protein, partial [Phycisphaerae bacterium]
TEVNASSSAMKLSFGSGATGTSDFIRADDLAMQFGDKRLFSDLSFQIPPGERFAITGPNGTGKTTLLRILMEELEPSSGELDIPATLQVGYYAQEGKHLEPKQTVLEHIRAAREGFSELEARSFAARFLFTGDDVFKEIGSLSGGEQSRVRLAALLLSAPDVLILDEPTNHLDIPSREVLEESLLDFNGSIIVISHDRYFLDRIAERLLVIRPEGHRIHTGNYSSYIEYMEQEKARREEEKKKNKPKVEKKPEQQKPKKSAASRFDTMSVDDLEAMVIDLECQLSEIQTKFGDSDIYKNPEALESLREEQARLEKELSEVDLAWQERAEE